MSDIIKTKTALISVWDKTGLEPLVKALHEKSVQLYATLGTGKYLKESLGVDFTPIESVTDFPEMMDGRVKTLHPKIFGGLLARRDNPQDMASAKEYNIPLFDLVIANLYPFWEKVGASTVEQSAFVDIGGPSMIRAASKNHVSLTVLSHPDDYAGFLEEFSSNHGGTSLHFRKKQAALTFGRTAYYDSMIAKEWSDRSDRNAPLAIDALPLQPRSELRYGENPHQKAFFAGMPGWKVIQGKALSYNNLLDAEAARGLAAEFKRPAVAIIKHNNPCGVASFDRPLNEVFATALKCDEKSAFGGVVAINQEIDEATAKLISAIFFEVILAPKFSEAAKAVLSTKKNLRLIEYNISLGAPFDVRRALGGWLVQEVDAKGLPSEVAASSTNPDIEFAWLVCKHVKSNAIVLAKDGRTLGIGAGQMSRVDAVEIAISRTSTTDLEGAVLASDAFFPFRDNIDRLKGLKLAAVVQPGGSVRDAEVIEAAKEIGLPMLFTGQRHFRH